MDANKATEELAVIRQLMARPIRFSSMSGLAAIQAGVWALIGIAGDYWAFRRLRDPREALLVGGAIWAAVFVLAVVGVLLLTRRREIAQGMPFWSPVKRRILSTILPPFVAAVGLTLIICARYAMTYSGKGYPILLEWDLIQGYLIPSIWMLFYGVALWQLGQFSPGEVKVLGAAFIAAGLATALLWQGYPYWVMGITFGGFHILYGLVVWIRHGG
ncbi:MAG: hypothetical protein ACYTFO_02185 [Planctomycetota bacterium]|jgi:hypothetical protein